MMKKVAKYGFVMLFPLILLKLCAWLLNSIYAQQTELLLYPWHGSYLCQVFLCAVITLFIFFLFRWKFTKKEWPVFVIPLLYLLFFALPYGTYDFSVWLSKLIADFYIKYTIPLILFFTYVIRFIVLFIDGKNTEK